MQQNHLLDFENIFYNRLSFSFLLLKYLVIQMGFCNLIISTIKAAQQLLLVRYQIYDLNQHHFEDNLS